MSDKWIHRCGAFVVLVLICVAVLIAVSIDTEKALEREELKAAIAGGDTDAALVLLEEIEANEAVGANVGTGIAIGMSVRGN